MTTETGTQPADTPAATPARRRVDPVLVVAIVLAIAAVGSAIYSGISWFTANGDDQLTYSRDRDAALEAGEQGIQNFNTMDYRNPGKYFDLWASSSTGDLNNQVSQYRKDKTVLSDLSKAKAVTTARVLEGAVTELDDHAGKASVIVALDVTVRPATGKPTDKRTRLEGDLTKTGSGWLLSSIAPVPVDNTGQ